MAKEFDPDKHHRRNYGTDKANRLPPEEVKQQLQHFQKVIKDTTINYESPVIGVVIYGSYARSYAGLVNQVYDESDLDIKTISRNYLSKKQMRLFVDKLYEDSSPDNKWGRIGIYVQCLNNLALHDPKKVRKSFNRGGVIGKYYVIVTPYPEIEQELKAILAKK